MQFLVSLLLPFALVVLIAPTLARLAPSIGLLDRPDQRKRHHGAVPLVGGLAMALACALTLVMLGTHDVLPASFVVAALALLAMGAIDDRRPLPSMPRFVLQGVFVWFAVTHSGTLLADVGRLLGPELLTLGSWSIALTVFGVLGVMNAVNMSDGADGLGGGLAATAAGSFLIAFAYLRSDGGFAGADLTLPMTTLCGAVLGFLVFNLRTPWRPRASMFMGDAGSLLLGFCLGWVAVVAAGQPGTGDLSPVAALWILIVPLFDTVWSMTRRMLQGRSPMSADREHMHHLLQAAGMSPARAVATLIAANAAGGAIGIAGWRTGVPDYWMFATIAALFVSYAVVSSMIWSRVRLAALGATSS